ncbi:AraC family transcriptional regulator [Oxalobacteraceae bacterium A2-2]
MDALSDVLSLLKTHSYRAGGFDAAGAWAIQFPRHEGIKCYAVMRGACWLAVEGVAQPLRLTEGDCFLLPGGRPFRLASDLELAPVDALAVLADGRNGVLRKVNGGGEMLLAGGHFTFAGGEGGILLGMLAPIIHMRTEAERAAMRWSLERMIEELREQRPGCLLVAQQLAQMMLIQALRLHLEAAAQDSGGGVGWLYALADKQMGAAINAMHAEPARRWTLAALARQAGMSRSSFAVKFKETVGSSPMDYLTRWRMLLAGDKLSNTSLPISAIAASLGYESDSAFSTAFKRIMGCPPRAYSRGMPLAGAEAG